MVQSASQRALVTGASSGLGIALAGRLAAEGIDLVLTARREEPMQRLAADLRARHGVDVIVEPADLSEPGAAAILERRLAERDAAPDILVNNAAFGLAGTFTEHDPARLRAMLQLDIVALTELCHLFAPRMVRNGHGHILLVASLAAYQPTPRLAAYGAAKAFVLSFGEALHVELAPTVGVTVLSPGLMDTGFFAVADYHPAAALRRRMLSPDTVAAIGIEAMFRRKPSVVAGRINAAMAFSGRFLSRHSLAKVVDRLSKP